MIKAVETFVVDGRPYGAVWVDHGYRSGPRVKLAGSLGAIRYVPGSALDEARAEKEAAEGKLKELRDRVEAEIERYREVAADLDGHDRTARMVGCTFVADRLAALLDQPPQATSNDSQDLQVATEGENR